jgi:hypothetical protein
MSRQASAKVDAPPRAVPISVQPGAGGMGRLPHAWDGGGSPVPAAGQAHGQEESARSGLA